MVNITEIRNKSFVLTKKVIDKIGPRLAGTKDSLDAAEMLKEEIKTYTDNVELEEFNVYKGAFLGWIRILVSCYLLAVVFLWIKIPIVSVILIVFSLLILVFQFFLYKPMIDKFYPKKKGLNVIGKVEPSEDVKNQVIISGHHDSARIFNFFIHQPSLYNLRVTGGIALIIVLLLVSVISIFLTTGVIALILKIIVSLGFLLTGQMWFFASSKGTPGAGDNLISSAMAIEIGRYFSVNKLKSTRVIIASFDAEEEGLRGARAYAKKHKDEFKEIPTYLLNVDCPYYLNELFFMTSDINCSVELSTELATELVEIAHSKNYPATHKPITFLTGGTDAGELAKQGVHATTLMAMPWSNSERASVYHTPNDTIDSIEKETIDAAIDIFITFIKNKE
ncbi:M28 family metallopeptidase [Candidatus Izimaplasma bacterium]|nr:M28 family metallopeptidase [Candidatus Izimaplasma bacterium]